MLIRLLSVLALLTLAACVTQGADVYGPEGSEFLVNVSGSYSFTDRSFGTAEDGSDIPSFEQETLSGQVAVGYFLSEAHELGALFFGSLTRIERAGDSHILFAGPYYNFNIRLTETSTFYVGPQVGLTNFDAEADSATELSYGGHAGLRFWLSPSTAFSIEPRYTITNFDDEFGGETKTLDLLFGLNVIL